MSQVQGIKRTRADIIFEGIIMAFMVVVCIVIIYPFINMLAVSVSDDRAILRGEVFLLPKGFDPGVYANLMKTPAVFRSLKNTFLVAVGGCMASLLMTSLAAYPIMRGDFYGSRLYKVMVLLPLWFSAGMVPTYLVISRMGLLDQLSTLALVALISPYNTLILSSFMKAIPYSLYEAAKIDGAGDFRILFQIVIPLSKASLATIALWIVVGHWNAYMEPLMYLSTFEKFTLQMVLRDIIMAAETAMYDISSATGDNVSALSEQTKNAMLIISMIPMLCFYPVIQKYFVKGVMLGSVKG